MTLSHASLEQQREDFANRPFLAMPTAGLIAWLAVAIAGATLPPAGQVWALYIATGSIFGIGVLIAPLFGEDLLGRHRPRNEFDGLFMSTVVSAWLVFAIAIPFVQRDHTSLPLTVGILAGLMWLPFSWIIRHWIGVFHGIVRTLALLAAWYLFPTGRFVVLPLVIVAMYVITLAVLARRARTLPSQFVAA